MLFLEAYARLGLIVHAVLGAATVAAATHLVVWIRRYPAGHFGRHRAARWFATTAFVLCAVQFTVGNLIYPVYRARVRAEYFELASAVTADVRARADARRAVAPPATDSMASLVGEGRDLIWAGRLFDLKEHWAALGLALAAAACALAWSWNPSRDGPGPVPFFVGLAVAHAATMWFSALVGLFVSSLRAIGGS